MTTPTVVRVRRPSRFDGPACPADPEHGPLLADRSPAGDGYGWTCPHVAHDGRPGAHLEGRSPATRRRFTTAETESTR
jgi:hypothetical protein